MSRDERTWIHKNLPQSRGSIKFLSYTEILFVIMVLIDGT